jgi:hypothetical protein
VDGGLTILFWDNDSKPSCRGLVAKPLQQRRRKPLTGAPPVSCKTITGLYLTRCRGLATKPLGLETKPLHFLCTPGRAIPGFAWAVRNRVSM